MEIILQFSEGTGSRSRRTRSHAGRPPVEMKRTFAFRPETFVISWRSVDLSIEYRYVHKSLGVNVE